MTAPRALAATTLAVALACALATGGCGGSTDATGVPAGGPETSREARRPANPPVPAGSTRADVSGDTPKDLRFAEFVRETAGAMVRDVAVGIEDKGLMQVVLGEATAPEDTLPLARSLIAGARKDYPGEPFTLSVFDPGRDLILKAHYDPSGGVRYELPGRGEVAREPAPEPDEPRRREVGDAEFERWAVETAGAYIRDVEADLERNGRLWFGVTREVAPEEVRDLTRSLLEGARTEFPGRELTATVYDPDGERIGTATLARDGRVDWRR